MIKTSGKELSKVLQSGTGRVYRYYFTEGLTTIESPILGVSLYGLLAALFSSFITLGFSPSLAGILAFSGLAWFSFFTLLHIFLWFTGSIYKNGLYKFISTGIVIIGMLLLLAIVGGFMLFGWVIPLLGFVTAYSSFVPEPLSSWLKPLMIIFMVIFALVWYSIGLSYFETV